MRSILVPVSLATILATASLAQDSIPEQPQQPPIDLPEDAAQEAPAPQDATPTDDAAPSAMQLEALVISVTGRGGRWRAPESDQWNPVQVDDVLPAGSQIDTGLRGEVGLRVGKNATLLISSASSVTLAEIEEADGRLVTRALLNKGAADFKVDHVGLENDFVVITPSVTAAVKGTGFRMAHGPMIGTQIEGVRANRVNAIEVGYFEVRSQIRMSGNARSSSRTKSPAMAALNKTVAPPPSTTPSDPAPADAQDTTQTQTLRNTQAVSNDTAAFASLLRSLTGDAGGIPARNPQPNPGQSGGPGFGPSVADGASSGSATPGPGPLPPQ